MPSSLSSSFRALGGAAVLLILGGCEMLPGKVSSGRLIDRDGTDVVQTRADYRELVIKGSGAGERVCLAPEPDYAASVGLGLNVAAAGDTAGVSESENALALGGRSPEVLLARALLYRACELTLNINADPQTAIQIYTRFLETIEKLNDTQAGSPPVAGASADGRAPASP